MTDHPYLSLWLNGTTCAHQRLEAREVLFENDTHLVLKHRSHRSYCGRMYGSKTCEAYAVLVTKQDFERCHRGIGAFNSSDLKALKRWSGRINPKVVQAECKDLGVVF